MPEPDLLALDRGLVVAPAGCGKTEMLTRALGRHAAPKPILILTHTNAGVAALRSRLSRAGTTPSSYRLATIDGWAMRLISTFPLRSGHDPIILNGRFPDYVAIRNAAVGLMAAGHVSDIVSASYARIFVDEYQDCSHLQHAIVTWLATLMPTAVVADPMQAIFGFDPRDPLATWDADVCVHLPIVGTLDNPWRWINAGAEPLGQWLLSARAELQAGRPIDIRQAPDQVSWVALDGTAADIPRQLEAGRTAPPQRDGTVLIMGDSRRPASQQRFAAQIPGAVTVEAVDLRDLVAFAEGIDLQELGAVRKVLEFAQKLMTNVGVAEMLQRLDTLRAGRARNPASDAENAALAFDQDRCHARLATLLVEVNRQTGVRLYRPAVFRACMQALQRCEQEQIAFAEAAIMMREEYRLVGRSLPKRAVGSTLLLKGLEADVSVILSADDMDARHLYVAMTRGSQRLIVCSRSPVLGA